MMSTASTTCDDAVRTREAADADADADAEGPAPAPAFDPAAAEGDARAPGLRCQRKSVGAGEPPGTTVKVVEEPGTAVLLPGWVTIDGAVTAPLRRMVRFCVSAM